MLQSRALMSNVLLMRGPPDPNNTPPSHRMRFEQEARINDLMKKIDLIEQRNRALLRRYRWVVIVQWGSVVFAAGVFAGMLFETTTLCP
jgi:hypothetical protein